MTAAVVPGIVVGDRYVIEELLGRGGMAEVYRARDVASRRPVAVKILEMGAGDARRFDRETRLLAGLEHRNLVRLLDAGRHGAVPYLVLELVEGPTLADRLEDGPLSAAEVRTLGRDIGRALAYVHAEGVIHRDVKPSNIMFSSTGRALLGDFGAARLVDGPRLTAARATVGTVAYLAPEQISDVEAVGPAADVYALGLVLLEALSGRPAFTGTHQEMLGARMARDPRIPALPSPWPRLLRLMTCRDPAARPGAAAVAAVLATHRTDPVVDTAELDLTSADITADLPSHGTVPAPAPTPPRQRFVWLLAGLVAVAGLGAIVAASVGGDDGSPGPTSSAPTASVTTTAVATAPTTVSTTTTTGATTTAPSTTAGTTGELTCVELDAQRQAIDAQRQQVEETYRNDPETREAVKRQLREERQAIDAEERALGC